MLIQHSLYARHERDTLGTGTMVSFVENRGQWEGDFTYQTQLHDAAIFLSNNAITIALRERIGHPAPAANTTRMHAYRMTFAGTSGNSPNGLYEQKSYNNYYLGDSPARWRSRIPSFDAVNYTDLYPGIDLEIFGGNAALKYNLIVHQGADPSLIEMVYEGTDGVEVTSKGNLLIRTSVRDVVEMKPYVYQVSGNGDEVTVSSQWRVSRTKEGQYRATIEVGDYNHDIDLVIDPVLIFSTYTGSTADNWGTTATYDSHKNVYTAGLAFNIGYPVSLGAYQPSYAGGSCDIAIFKFDPLGTQRLYATYLGGNSTDMPHSLFVNTFDELLIFGTTGSSNFPVTTGAFQTSFAGGQSLRYLSSALHFEHGSDIFVSRISADGTQLQASTFVGGSGNDGLNYRDSYTDNYLTVVHGNDSLYYNYGDGARGEIITDNLNNVYIGSTTFSSDFPVSAGAIQTTSGGKQDGIVFKIDYNLRTLLWSTYLGGSNDDAIYSIDVDSAYNLLVCGGTNSHNFPTTSGTLHTSYIGGAADGFVSKISYGGERLMASSYVGFLFYDQLYFVRNGNHNDVFLFGQSRDAGISLILNAAYNIPNSGMLLMRLSPDITTLRWSTLFGTPNRINLSPTAFAVDICNRIYAAGWGRDFVGYGGLQFNTAGTTGMETTPDAICDTTDGQDFYIISIDDNANNLLYASFFGEYPQGDHVDGGTSRFDRLATLYQSVCASCGGHNGFPVTAGAWSDSNRSSNCNNALFRINITEDFPVAEFIPPTVGCAPYTVQFNNTGRGESYLWDFGDGTTSTLTNPSHTYATGGIYTVTLTAFTSASACTTSDEVTHTIHVIGNNTTPSTSFISCNNTPVQIGPSPQLGASYQWLSTDVSDPAVANPWVSDSGTYLLRVSTFGCSEIDTFVVHTYILTDTVITNSPICPGGTDGSITILLNPNLDQDSITVNSPYTFSRSSSTVTFPSLTEGSVVDWTVQGYNCITEGSTTVPHAAPIVYNRQQQDILCTDSCQGYLHLWSDDGTTPDTLIDNLCPGKYTLNLTDVRGCHFSDSINVTRDSTLIGLQALADRHQIFLGQNDQLHANTSHYVSNATPSIVFSWFPASDLNRPDISDPIATPSDTLVCYTVEATSLSGCKASDSVCIHATDVVCGQSDFNIPNAFTPNGDGVNDMLCFNADIIAEFRISIFNRWGQCVYSSNDPCQCWDGTFLNQPALSGVYTYTCHIRCHNNIENDFKGDITLIR
ncbi:MAG: gliding motility-associated C-terminal domain-containing protein [Bacteroidales bacterium]|nr:gliding motility-associated C-terminal domain-containing protein [Bacteroidales bacterium]